MLDEQNKERQNCE